MKVLCCLLALLMCSHWCLAQTDGGVVGVGDWSEPVRDDDGHTLRGRLLVYDDQAPSAANHARVYLELEHVFAGAWPMPVEIYFDVAELELKLCDGHDQPVPTTPIVIRGPRTEPCWITLPCDSSLRVRGDVYN